MKKRKDRIVATFSIVAYDPDEQAWGVAVQSKFLGVGSVVPFAQAGVGAVATQSLANPAYGPGGLMLMAEGKSAEEAVKIVTGDDPERAMRQVGMVDADGNAATYTGDNCYDWAGGVTGKHYAAQGNILVNKETVTEMGAAFEAANGTLAERLLTALDAAQTAGGDSRGKQSAALLVVKENGGYGGLTDRAVDLRVDDHPEPIRELKRIHKLHDLYFSPSSEEDVAEIDEGLKQELTRELARLDYITNAAVPLSDDAFHRAFSAFLHTENFEEREQERGYIDLAVLRYMKEMKKN